MDNLSSKQKIILIIVGIIVSGLFILCIYTRNNIRTNESYSNIENLIENSIEESEIDNEDDKIEKKLIIHISGAVKKEGIVEVNEGSRINDVIQEAGGLTDESDLTSVNLAYLVKDGQKIYIPNKSDFEKRDVVTKENGENIILEYENTENKININTANKNELGKLNGIGEGTAEKIIEHRELNGAFKSIEDIKNVSGIGDAKYESIKDKICI